MSAARRSCRALWGALALAGLLGVSGCSLWGGSSKPKPAELGPNVPVLGVRQAWTARIGAVEGVALDVHVNGNVVTLASANGEVAAIDARTGGDVWRTQLNMQLASGVGSDGRWSAVVSRNAQVVVLDGAREIWRKSLPAQAYTAPLVAGHRVFVLAADRSITAFDAATGYQLWRQQRPGEPLILREGGVLMAVGDTLVAGLSGRLVGFNPDNGVVRWEAPWRARAAPTTWSAWSRSWAAPAVSATAFARGPSRPPWVASMPGAARSCGPSPPAAARASTGTAACCSARRAMARLPPGAAPMACVHGRPRGCSSAS